MCSDCTILLFLKHVTQDSHRGHEPSREGRTSTFVNSVYRQLHGTRQCYMAVEGREYTYIQISACRQATAGNMLRGRACEALSCTHLWSRISHRRILRDCAGKRISSCPCLLMLSQWCYRTRDAPHALMYTMRQALYHRGVVALFPCSGNTFRGSWPSFANALDSSNDTSTDLGQVPSSR